MMLATMTKRLDHSMLRSGRIYQPPGARRTPRRFARVIVSPRLQGGSRWSALACSSHSKLPLDISPRLSCVKGWRSYCAAIVSF